MPNSTVHASSSDSESTRDVCYVVHNDDTEYGCLDPSSLLDKSRCIDSCPPISTSSSNAEDALQEQLCIDPHKFANLLRITTIDQKSQSSQVIFHKGGNREEIWKDVLVDKWQSTMSMMPQSLPHDIVLFWQ